jgi:hypothetical protein
MKKITLTFKKEDSANNFAGSLSILEGKASVSVEGTRVAITSDDPMIAAFAKNIMSDINEEILYVNMKNRFLKAMAESLYTGNSTTLKLMDGTVQKITPSDARSLALVHDMLSESNQLSFLVLAAENKGNFQKAIAFAKAKQEETE